MSIFNLDISDCSIEVLRLKKGLFGKLGVSFFGRVELEEGIVKNGEILDPQKLAEKLGELVKGQKVNFTLPDLRIFTCRVLLPLDISRSATEPFLKDKVIEVVPYDFEDLAYDFKVVNETEKGKEVLFIAIPKEILIGYLKTFKMLRLTPFSAVPESVAAFEIFKGTVTEDEIVLFVDIGSQTSTLSFFDKFGPFLTLNKPVETKALKEGIKKAADFLKKREDKEIKRVILGGGGSLKIDAESFSKEIGTWTTKAEKILEDKLLRIPLTFNVGRLPSILFFNVLGLALLSQRKEGLNLLRKTKDLLIKLAEQELEEKKVKKKGESEEKREEEEEEIEGKPREAREEMVFSAKFFKALARFKYLLIIIIVALLTFFGVYLVKRISTQEVKEKGPAPSPTVQPPTPSPTIKLNRRDLLVKVLNGSGVPGGAKKAASVLEELGYKVVETGNADSFDYEETVIKIKEGKKNLLSLLTNDLKSHYTVSSEKFELGEEEEADALVIVGKK